MAIAEDADEPLDLVSSWDTTVWAYAAVIATLRDVAATSFPDAVGKDSERAAVLEAAGIIFRGQGEPAVSLEMFHDGSLAGSAAAARLTSLRQALDAAIGEPPQGWMTQSDDVLLGQGRASAATGHALATRIAPTLADLSDRLDRPGSRALDVGTGIGALALALALELPHTHVTGIDNSDRVLLLAEHQLAASGPEAKRVELRLQNVVDLVEEDAYDLIWLPAPFLSEAILENALPKLLECLKNEGWLIVGSNPDPGTQLGRAVAIWVATRNGGSAVAASDMAERLTRLGLRDVRSIPTVSGGPILVAGQKPKGARPTDDQGRGPRP